VNGSANGTSAAVYRGIWGVLARWFKVPTEPPTLPFHDSESIEGFRPARAFLQYLRVQFWIVAGVLAVTALVLWVALLVASPLAGALLALPMAALVGVAMSVAFLALHLQFDATWYVLTDRSLRIRRGIWTICETTITFENIQNVVVNQGPLQRYFGIADVVVQTAGGGAGAHAGPSLGPHAGVLGGLQDAPRIRDLIQLRLTQSRSAGLGDDAHQAETHGVPRTWTAEHLAALRAIRDLARSVSTGT
jgi:membrane protein YdbS with pleckstrin-like domain